MVSLGQVYGGSNPVAACSSIFLPSGYSENVTCDPSAGGVNYVAPPDTAGSPDTAPLQSCDAFTVPPGFQGNIPCDSSGSDLNVASAEIESAASVTPVAANTVDSSDASSGANWGLLLLIAAGIYFFSEGGSRA